MSGHECAWCEAEIEGEPVREDTEAWWLGKANARTWCNDDCQTAHAERAFERQQADFYGGSR